ncbi:MAG TPA: hypothetical protein DHN33_09400, partial [Eubacteriaceae bacterium]|nr:hypothetical protein [Eubacteriaceae bacterium]
MKLYIVRHGLTQWNLDKIIQGCIDTELLPQGRDDAQVLSEKIGDYPVEIVYTSPLRRAYDTAQILNQSIKKPLVVKEKLREIEFGDWEGLTWREVKEKYPDLLADNEIGYANPPNGETFLQAKERVGSAVEEIIEKQQDCL